MKATGFVRKVDDLGRIVIPMELRRQLGIATGDSLETLVNGSDVVLQKWHAGCVFCGARQDTVKYRGRVVCGACVRGLGEIRLDC